MNERDLQSRVIDLAKLRGWLVMHQRPARTLNGQWRTAIEGNAGFPDLVLAKNGIVLFRELKSDTGRLTANQTWWSQHLPNWALWRPKDWDSVIVPTLGGLVFGGGKAEVEVQRLHGIAESYKARADLAEQSFVEERRLVHSWAGRCGSEQVRAERAERQRDDYSRVLADARLALLEGGQHPESRWRKALLVMDAWAETGFGVTEQDTGDQK